MTGAKAQHIPYKSSNAALIDLVAGSYQYNFTGMQTAQPYLRSGRLKAIAVTSLKRQPGMPQVTNDERGVARLRGDRLVRPACARGTAGADPQLLNTEVVRIVQQPAFGSR